MIPPIDGAAVLAEAGSLHISNETGESRWSEGGDGLRKTGPRQLGLALADSPRGADDRATRRIRAVESPAVSK
jgi:hypothetical protein